MHKFRFRRFFRRFKVQLIFWFILIILLPSCMISLFYFKGTAAGQLERQEKLLNQQAGEQASLLESRIEAIEKGTLSITTNASFKEYLLYAYKKPAHKVRDALYSFQPMLGWLLTTNPHYHRIHFLTTSPYTAGDPYVDGITNYENVPWVVDTLTAGPQGNWQNIHSPQAFPYAPLKEKQVVSYALAFAGTKTNIVLIDIDKDWLYQGIPFVTLEDTGEIIASHADPKALGQKITLGEDHLLQTVFIGETEYYLSAKTNEKLGIRVISCMETLPVKQSIAGNNRYFLFWLAVSISTTLVLVIIFSNSVVKRMTILRQNISKITRGNYDVHFEVKRNDEIDQLGSDVVVMGQQMNYMVNQELNQQMLLREAEFRALQQQINPHFIFNMLQTVQMMAEINNQRELADVIAQFGRMVRYNLHAEKNVTLHEELENARDYLMLQKLMYNEELHATFNVDESYLDVEIPCLILQPLVENAVLHGKIKDRVLLVSITVQKGDKGIDIIIENDGKPLKPEREALLAQTLEEVVLNPGSVDGINAKDNLALINIQKRLHICFGTSCRLSIGNVGNRVRVAFTIRQKEGEN